MQIDNQANAKFKQRNSEGLQNPGIKKQKQPFRGVLKKRCSENVQQNMV